VLGGQRPEGLLVPLCCALDEFTLHGAVHLGEQPAWPLL
jgi:hypothetical protein